MPNIKSSKKSVKRSEILRIRNNSVKNKIRNLVRKFEESLESKDLPQISDSLKKVQSALSMSVSKGVFHKSKSSRKVSRLNARAKSALQNKKTVSEPVAK